ncbi:hypothetical protein CORC01_11229, partial [Colletotrichum orchidophilum]
SLILKLICIVSTTSLLLDQPLPRRSPSNSTAVLCSSQRKSGTTSPLEDPRFHDGVRRWPPPSSILRLPSLSNQLPSYTIGRTESHVSYVHFCGLVSVSPLTPTGTLPISQGPGFPTTLTSVALCIPSQKLRSTCSDRPARLVHLAARISFRQGAHISVLFLVE